MSRRKQQLNLLDDQVPGTSSINNQTYQNILAKSNY